MDKVCWIPGGTTSSRKPRNASCGVFFWNLRQKPAFVRRRQKIPQSGHAGLGFLFAAVALLWSIPEGNEPRCLIFYIQRTRKLEIRNFPASEGRFTIPSLRLGPLQPCCSVCRSGTSLVDSDSGGINPGVISEG